jgi:hypothetical protein
MDMKLVDVTVHIDENLEHDARERLRDRVLAVDGVVAAVNHDEKPHLMIVEYNPDRTSSMGILTAVKESGVHAELIGL